MTAAKPTLPTGPDPGQRSPADHRLAGPATRLAGGARALGARPTALPLLRHGYEVRDQRLAVLGASPEAITHALLVRQWTPDLILFPNAATVTAAQREQLVARGIVVRDEPVSGLVIEDDRLRGVALASGAVVERDAAVFVRPGFVANDTLLTDLGCALAPTGWVATDPAGRPASPGVWAAGNAANPRAQAITAAGEGSAAAIAINNDLSEEDTRKAVGSFRLGLPIPCCSAPLPCRSSAAGSCRDSSVREAG